MKKLAFIASLLTNSALAEPAVMRSGEHEDFTRLVLDFKSRREWSLDEKPGLLTIDFGSQAIDVDTSNVFRLIPKNRVKDVRPSEDKSDILIEVDLETHARIFELEGGAIVVDVISGRNPEKISPLPKPDIYKSPKLPLVGRSPSEHMDRLALYWGPQKSTEQPSGINSTAEQPSSSRVNLSAAEEALRQQIARAAVQGLIEVDVTDLEVDPIRHSTDTHPEKDEGSAENLAMQSQTAIDRDNPTEGPFTVVSNDGTACVSDAQLDLAKWLNDMRPVERLTEARQSLLGEFDRPEKDNVLVLAKTFLAIGFGAEARSILAEFLTDDEDAFLLADVGAIIDGVPIPQNSPLLLMHDCDTNAALWAVLAGAPLDASLKINMAAVNRGFSALPGHLRLHLGPRLIKRLIDMQHRNAAQAIRDAMSRVEGEDHDSIAIADAMIASEEQSHEPDPALIKAESRPGESENSALLLRVEHLVRSGEPVDDATIDNTEALAYEYLGTPEGSAFLRAHILSLGSVGRFEAAFQEMDQWPLTDATALREETLVALFTQLSKVPSDEIFLANTLQRLDTIPSKTLPTDLISKLAERLLDQGFAQATQKILLSVMSPTDETRILLSRGSLQLGDGAAALAHISGLNGTEADAIRGEAFQLIGDHANARLAFHRAGDSPAEARAAWRTDDRSATLRLGTTLQRELLKLSSQQASTSTDVQGTISSSKYSLEQSRQERKVIERLLEATHAVSGTSSR